MPRLTRKYWIPIYNVLEDTLNVYLTHLEYSSQVGGRRQKREIHGGFCKFFMYDLVKSKYIPVKLSGTARGNMLSLQVYLYDYEQSSRVLTVLY